MPVSVPVFASPLILDAADARRLDRSQPTPLYHQIFLLLRARIVRGEIEHGARLATEIELAEQLQVSRVTVKRALDALAAEGLVARRRGRGTHVVHRRRPGTVEAPLIGLLENLEVIAEQTEVRLLRFARQVPPAAIRELFDIDSATELALAVRVRSSEGVAFGHYLSWTRTAHPDFNATELGRSSRIRLFERCAIKFAQVEQIHSACAADQDDAAALGIAQGHALSTLERRSYDPDGALVDWLSIHYHPERFQYRMLLSLGGREVGS